MGDLLSNILELLAFELIRLTQERIEWLAESIMSAWVLRYGKHGHLHQSNEWICLSIRLTKNILVLHDLNDFLHHGQWLIEVHWHCESGEILPNGILEDLENTWLLVWIFLSW